MFKYFIAILFLCSYSSNLFAQKRFNPERKYAIVLPDRWKNSPKLLLKITSLVSAFVPELEDKQECLDCGANYWIKFYVSSLQIDDISYRPNQQEFFTYYRFLGFLDVYNIDGYLLRRLFINTKKDSYGVASRPLDLARSREEKNVPFDSEAYIRQNTYKLIPNENQLWDQLEEVIKDLKINPN